MSVFCPRLPRPTPTYPFASGIWAAGLAGAYVWFNELAKIPPFGDPAARIDLLARLNKISGVDLPEDTVDTYRAIYLSALTDEPSLGTFLEALEWAVQRMEQADRRQPD